MTLYLSPASPSCMRTGVEGGEGGTGILPGDYNAGKERQGSDNMILRAT